MLRADTPVTTLITLLLAVTKILKVVIYLEKSLSNLFHKALWLNVCALMQLGFQHFLPQPERIQQSRQELYRKDTMKEVHNMELLWVVSQRKQGNLMVNVMYLNRLWQETLLLFELGRSMK